MHLLRSAQKAPLALPAPEHAAAAERLPAALPEALPTAQTSPVGKDAQQEQPVTEVSA